MTDMLVKLYDLPDIAADMERLAENNIAIKRPLAADKQKILSFVDEHFRETSAGWVYECEVTLLRQPVSCFIAEYDKQVIGFACYDATAKGFFGPIGVSAEHRKLKIGKVLMVHCLQAMHAEGYGYAVIGWVSSEAYYQKTVGAIPIPNSEPGEYQRLVGF